jgi:DnaK suppressor protein
MQIYHHNKTGKKIHALEWNNNFEFSKNPRMKRYSRKELELFKEVILKKREEALGDYREMMQSMRDNSTKDTDPLWINVNNASEVVAIEELNMNAERLKRFVDSLNAALARIENGTYGVCVKTGELIPKERLMAVPHATLSVEAKLQKR